MPATSSASDRLPSTWPGSVCPSDEGQIDVTYVKTKILLVMLRFIELGAHSGATTDRPDSIHHLAGIRGEPVLAICHQPLDGLNVLTLDLVIQDVRDLKKVAGNHWFWSSRNTHTDDKKHLRSENF